MSADFSFPQPVFKPPLAAWPDAGVYQLWSRVTTARRIRVGRLGRFLFPAGLYVYTGRASRGLRARVARHTRRTCMKHWHIDYLLGSAGVGLEKVTLVSRDPSRECATNQHAGEGAACPVLGFGSSDCRQGCLAHLWRVERSKKVTAAI
jgi:Uri superfamily endonuclease